MEVHSIHWGYLLDQFALSMMNHRTDEYGGSLENRLRAAKEILGGIKQECGSNFPVSMRLGLKTFVKGFEKAALMIPFTMPARQCICRKVILWKWRQRQKKP